MNHPFELIPLTVEAKAEIIANNLPEFREMVKAAIAGINRDLATDEDFDQAAEDVKKLKYAEDTVRETALKVFDEQIQALHGELNAAADEFRLPRLELEKLIKDRKEQLRAGIVETYLAEYDIDPMDAQRHFKAGLESATKGKRTVESMEMACRVYQSMTQSVIYKTRAIIESFEKAHGPEMVMDRRELELKSPEYVEGELRRRFEAKKAADERARLEAEADKAKAELETTKAPAMKGMLPKSDLPPPPKIGSIPVGNVVPFDKPKEALTEDQEWMEMKATVIFAFGLIKEQKEKMRHDRNVAAIEAFGADVNAAWKIASESRKQKEVAL